MSEQQQTKECPFCAEQVNINAKKCKHCGETIDVTLRMAEDKKSPQNPMVFMNAGGGGASAAAAASSGNVPVIKKDFPHFMHAVITFFLCPWAIVWWYLYTKRDMNIYN